MKTLFNIILAILLFPISHAMAAEPSTGTLIQIGGIGLFVFWTSKNVLFSGKK